ncbi:hypothetical protein EJ08DRAFT_707993 [Tothia fuscella]|uniref:Uncharacterized protein n=1 Tax=Tothia fuscella TaxID=1048955 RepID=A0A9P4NXH1_9PEZI|nr:hypothetical protein EJ08DRAFT_707993 [Tothia fuscella]
MGFTARHRNLDNNNDQMVDSHYYSDINCAACEKQDGVTLLVDRFGEGAHVEYRSWMTLERYNMGSDTNIVDEAYVVAVGNALKTILQTHPREFQAMDIASELAEYVTTSIVDYPSLRESLKHVFNTRYTCGTTEFDILRRQIARGLRLIMPPLQVGTRHPIIL